MKFREGLGLDYPETIATTGGHIAYISWMQIDFDIALEEARQVCREWQAKRR